MIEPPAWLYQYPNGHRYVAIEREPEHQREQAKEVALYPQTTPSIDWREYITSMVETHRAFLQQKPHLAEGCLESLLSTLEILLSTKDET